MNIIDAYQKNRSKTAAVFALLTVLLAVIFCYAAFSGYTDIRPGDVLVTLFPKLAGRFGGSIIPDRNMTIFLNIRMPRVVLALIAGTGLGVCGCVMQSITGNDMASPFTTGISSAAAFGAALGIVFHPFSAGKLDSMILAFTAAIINYIVVYSISAARGMGPKTLILVGVALNYLFSAMNSAMQYLVDSDTLASIVYWTFGSFTGADWDSDITVAAAVALSLLFFSSNSWGYNIISSTDDESATAMGINVKRLRIASGCVVTLVVSAIISFTGIIGFIGLVAPHIARILIGGNYRTLLPLTAMIGAILVLLADTIGRTWFSPVIIPVGIIVSFLGVPLFIALIIGKFKG